MSSLYTCPYINFQGRAREAMEFYHEVLGGNLNLLTMGENGVPKPAGSGDSIIHAHLDADGAVIMATDGSPDYPPTVGDNFAITLGGTDGNRLTKAFEGLAVGGRIKMPLASQSWGAQLGYFADKFGVNWMVSIENE